MTFYSKLRWALTIIFGLLLILAFVASTGNNSGPSKSPAQKVQQSAKPSTGAKFY